MDGIRNYLSQLQRTLERLPVERIEEVVRLLHRARLERRHIFIMGNGGSAATASHFACDLGKNTRRQGYPHYRVLALTDNMATFSAYGNDDGYESVFAYQLDCFLDREDVVIGISTSGNSDNVLEAMRLARERGATTVGFTGFDGGRLRELVDVEVHVESDWIEQVEDVHLILEHLITCVVRELADRQPGDAATTG